MMEVFIGGKSILIVLPVAVIFLFSQRFIRAGQLAGAEKG